MKKFLALMLVLASLVSLLAGCGEKKTGDTNTPTVTDTPSTDAEDDYLPIVKNGEHKVITLGIQQSANVIDYDTNDFTLWIEEQTGIDLEFYYFSTKSAEAKQQLALMMAGGETLPDILWNFAGLSANAVAEYGEDEYFVDLKPLVDEYSHFLQKRIDENLSYEPDKERIIVQGIDPDTGAMWGFPSYGRTQGIDSTANHILINTKWLEAVGETFPKSAEDFKRILVKFRDNDPNGNGEKDELPLIGSTKNARSNVMEWVLNNYIYLNDNYTFNLDENGTIWAPQVTEEYRQGLIFLNELYAEGLLAPMTFTTSTQGEMKELMTPSSGVNVAGVIGAGHVMLNHNEGSEQIFDYAVLPAWNETGKGGYRQTNDSTFNYQSYITEDCEDPVLAFQLLDFLVSEEAFLYMRFGLQGRDWDWAEEGMLDQWGEQAILNIIDSSIYSGQNNVNWHAMANIYDSACYGFYSAPAEAAKSYEERIELWYDKCLEDWITQPENPSLLLNMIWPAAKVAERTEVGSQCWNYIEEARALFVTGDLDPRSDADWQTYLDNLEATGFFKVLDLYQENYDTYYKSK